MRSWTLEGSVDGAQWHLLSTHENDAALAAKGATHPAIKNNNLGLNRDVMSRLRGAMLR